MYGGVGHVNIHSRARSDRPPSPLPPPPPPISVVRGWMMKMVVKGAHRRIASRAGLSSSVVTVRVLVPGAAAFYSVASCSVGARPGLVVTRSWRVTRSPVYRVVVVVVSIVPVTLTACPRFEFFFFRSHPARNV